MTEAEKKVLDLMLREPPLISSERAELEAAVAEVARERTSPSAIAAYKDACRESYMANRRARKLYENNIPHAALSRTETREWEIEFDKEWLAENE